MVQLFPKSDNFFKEIVWSQCGTPLYIYVETFVPAYIELVLTIMFMDMDDLIRDVGKDVARDPIKGSRRRRGHFSKGTISNDGSKPERWSQGALRTILRITDPIEKIGFAWLLYSATDQFFYNWQSLIQRRGFCEGPADAGPFSRSGVDVPVASSPAGIGIALPVLEQNRSNWANGAFAVQAPRGRIHVMLAATFTRAFSTLEGCQLRITVDGALGEREFDGPTFDIAPGANNSSVVTARFTAFGGLGASVGWQLVGPAAPAGSIMTSGAVHVFRETTVP